MTSKLKEVLMDANLLPVKHLFPDGCQKLLQRGLWCYEGAIATFLCPIRLRQGTPIYFPIRGPWQRRQHDKLSWDHVRRKESLKMLTQVCEPGLRHLPWNWYDMSYKLFFVWSFLTHRDHTLQDGHMGA